MAGRLKRSVAVRTAREFCAGVAGVAQQDLAVGSGIAPQWAIGCGRQHLSMDTAITGPRQAMAGAPSMNSASSKIPALRTNAIVGKVYASRLGVGKRLYTRGCTRGHLW